MSDLESFAEQLATLGQSQVEQAVALIWYRDHMDQGTSVSAKTLADDLHGHSLASVVNVSRLARQLARHADTVRGSTTNSFKIKASSRPKLDEKYSAALGRRRVRPTDSVVPREQFTGRRKCWQDLVEEINGCYDHGFHDGAAVLCRRLVEALIVEAFKVKKADAAIKSGNDYLMLDGLIGVVCSGQHIKLSKSARPALEPIQRVGNIAAHSPHHITTPGDVDGISNHVRVVVSELLNIIDES